MKRHHFFRVDNSLKTYTYPILKILICVVIIIFLINRNLFLHIDNLSLDFIVGFICVCIGIASILCIYISAAEMIIVQENRSKTQSPLDQEVAKSKTLSVDEVVSLLNNNDIIEIKIISNGKIVEIGSSSDSKAGSSKFFDKLFYIEKKEFESIDDFCDALSLYSDSGKIKIISIDGVSPKSYKLNLK